MADDAHRRVHHRADQPVARALEPPADVGVPGRADDPTDRARRNRSGKITKTERALRWLSIALVVVLATSALSATVLLIRDLIEGSPITANGTTLLATGMSVWAINIVAFALLYWEFDCGGPAVRAHGMPPSPDLAFPQQLNPESRRPGGDRSSSTICTWVLRTRWRSAPRTRCRSLIGRRSRWRSKE